MVGNRRAETPEHSLLKHIIASIRERAGGKPRLEVVFPDGSIVDVFDEKPGWVFEVQSKKQEEIERIKLDKYMTYAMVKDVFFIYTKDYPLDELLNSKAYNDLKKKLGV